MSIIHEAVNSTVINLMHELAALPSEVLEAMVAALKEAEGWPSADRRRRLAEAELARREVRR